MSKYTEVMIIVEGKTEQIFIDDILAPYLGRNNISMRATQVSKPGQKGGDVRFSRVKKDIGLHLKQRTSVYVSTFVDYYGIKEWPGLDKVTDNLSPTQIAGLLNYETKKKVGDIFPKLRTEKRFIPYISMHEFEALLFSDAEILASQLGIDVSMVEEVLSAFDSPESINNNPHTAPSKRLDNLMKSGKFSKITSGIPIAKKITIEKIRTRCPLFNVWLEQLEMIQRDS